MIRWIEPRTLLPVLFVTLISVGVYLYTSSLPKEVIIEFVDRFGWFGILAFILVNLITYIVAPMSNTPFLIAGYLLFGQQVIIYLAVAMLLSMITNYWIARVWGRKIVRRLSGEEGMKRVDNVLHRFDSLPLFVLIRLFQGAMHKFVSYAYGLDKMDFKLYLVVSLMTLIPYILIWSYLISFINDSVGFLLVCTILGSVLPLLISLFLLINTKLKLFK